MKKRLIALAVLALFVLGTASACVYPHHRLPGPPIKKPFRPGR